MIPRQRGTSKQLQVKSSLNLQARQASDALDNPNRR